MKHFMKIVVADIIILLIQTIMLFFWLIDNIITQPNEILIYFIFTMKNNTILFLNPPMLIFIYYVYLFLKHGMDILILKHSIVSILNFILLYCISWIEMLMLISLKFKARR